MEEIARHPWLQTGQPSDYLNQPQFSNEPEVYGKTFGQLPYVNEKLVAEMARKGYAIEYLIGQGGFGAVYKASKIDLQTEQRTPVAMKVISGLNKESRRPYLMSHRFKTEMKVMETFEHPNLVKVKIRILFIIVLSNTIRQQVFDVFKEKSRPQHANTLEKRVFIFMELADSDLHRLISLRKSIPENDLKPIILQVLTALEHLHSMKVAHRDIKPENILLFGNVAKVTDYSLVREVGNNPISLSGVGTPGYRAPEILLKMEDIGDIFKVDIWALGITIFKALTGSRPNWKPELVAKAVQQFRQFFANQDNVEEDHTLFLREHHKLKMQVMTLEKSEEVRDLLFIMLSFDPKDRPSATEAKSNPWFAEATLPESRARTPGPQPSSGTEMRPSSSNRQ